MWYLIEDFFEQNLVMKAFIVWGWLALVIMASSFVTSAWTLIFGGS
jgi:hypothetical protein